jgi:hypothetical protein
MTTMGATASSSASKGLRIEVPPRDGGLLDTVASGEGQCDDESKQALMSPSMTHSHDDGLLVKWWISAIASWARRPGRYPYDDG